MPGVSADVILPSHSGMIQLEQDEQIASLRMEGGTLVMHQTSCRRGWSPGNYNFDGYSGHFRPQTMTDGGVVLCVRRPNRSKCYKHFVDHKTFDEAHSICVDNYSIGNSLVSECVASMYPLPSAERRLPFCIMNIRCDR